MLYAKLDGNFLATFNVIVRKVLGFSWTWCMIRLQFRPSFDSRSTAIRPRYDRSTTTVGLPVVGCCTATLINK